LRTPSDGGVVVSTGTSSRIHSGVGSTIACAAESQKDVRVDLKPPARIRDSSIFRTLHREATECAICGWAPPLEAHHVLARSQGGDDVRANLVMLDPVCHQRITVNDEVARTLLGEHLMAKRWDVIDYVIKRLAELHPEAEEPGRDWLRRRLFIENE
jgi:hypothetical protein